jgi:hypothetical protein
MISRKALVIAVSLVLSAVVVTIVMDVIGGRLLQDDERRLNVVMAHVRDRASGYRRVYVTDTPLDQNAAVWYRFAFKALEVLPPDAFIRVRDAVYGDELVAKEAALQQYCQEIKSARVSDALRCTQCDWMVDAHLKEPQGYPYSPQTLILGYCLVLAGQVDEHAGHVRAAADRYFHAMAYASDLGQGTLPMAVGGIATSKTALHALTRLIGSMQDDASLLRVIKQRLSTRERAVPGLSAGVSWESSLVANALHQIARSYVARPSTPAARLWPWQAIGGWRLSRSMPLIDPLDAAASTEDLDRLRQLGRQINMVGAPRRGAVIYGYGLTPQWEPLIGEVAALRQFLAAVQVTVPLQEWRLAHPSYPAALPVSQVSATHKFSYQPSSDQHAYQLVSSTGAIVLEVTDGESPARSHKDKRISSPR